MNPKCCCNHCVSSSLWFPSAGWEASHPVLTWILITATLWHQRQQRGEYLGPLVLGSRFLKRFFYFKYRRKVFIYPQLMGACSLGAHSQHTGWGHPFWPLILRLWQQRNDGMALQLWIKNLNGTFSKFGLGKLWFKAVAESQKILCSGSAKAWSLSAFQDNLIWESKGCQSPRFQSNSAQESNRWFWGKPCWSQPAWFCWTQHQTISADYLDKVPNPTLNISRLSFPFSEVQS